VLRVVRRAGGRAGEVVERAVPSQDPTAGAGAELDPQLFERRVDAELSELGIRLETAHRCHGAQVGLVCTCLRRPRLVCQSVHALGDPTLQRLVDARPGRLQVAGDALDVPSFKEQAHDGETTLDRVSHLAVRRKASGGAGRRESLGQDALHGAMLDAAILEADTADRRKFPGSECRILGLQIDNVLADRGRQRPSIRRRGRRGIEQAGHPGRRESICLPEQRARGGSRLSGALRRCPTEQDDGAQELVRLLLWRADKQLDLLPIVSRLDATTLRAGHDTFRFWQSARDDAPLRSMCGVS
jgi:hypothetical protein